MGREYLSIPGEIVSLNGGGATTGVFLFPLNLFQCETSTTDANRAPTDFDILRHFLRILKTQN